MNLPWQARLGLVRKVVPFFFLAGIAFSYRLWFPERFFPRLPVLEFLSVEGHLTDYFFAPLLVVLLVCNIILKRRIIAVLTIAVLVILLLQDLSRWQPWVYVYLLLLLPFAIRPKPDEQDHETVSCLQIILIGVYAWSGIHKLNPDFADTIFYEILTRLFWFEEASWIAALKPVGYIIPIIEIGIAVNLFLHRYRNMAVYAAVITHLFILLYLSPLGIGANSVVYPWNLAMIVLVLLLFYNTTGVVRIRNGAVRPVLTYAAVALVWVMPFFNFFGLWDNYLSFSLYSGKTNAYYIVVGESELSKIDKRLEKYFLKIDGLQGGEIINLNLWTLGELNVPFYPETRTLKQLSKTFCALGIQEDQLYFLEFELPVEKQRFIRFTCSEVNDF